MVNTIVKLKTSVEDTVYLFVVTMTSNNLIHGLVLHSKNERIPVGTTLITNPINVESANVEFK